MYQHHILINLLYASFNHILTTTSHSLLSGCPSIFLKTLLWSKEAHWNQPDRSHHSFHNFQFIFSSLAACQTKNQNPSSNFHCSSLKTSQLQTTGDGSARIQLPVYCKFLNCHWTVYVTESHSMEHNHQGGGVCCSGAAPQAAQRCCVGN